jgi:hypothetical protein
VDIDVDGDESPDFAIVNQDLSGLTTLTDGRQIAMVYDLVNGGGGASFFVEHATNSANVILRACGSDLGLGLGAVGMPMNANFLAYSWYFGGPESVVGPFRLTPGGEEYAAAVPGNVLGYQQSANLTFQKFALPASLDSHQGILLVTNSEFDAGHNGGATADTEAVILPE